MKKTRHNGQKKSLKVRSGVADKDTEYKKSHSSDATRQNKNKIDKIPLKTLSAIYIVVCFSLGLVLTLFLKSILEKILIWSDLSGWAYTSGFFISYFLLEDTRVFR